VSSGRSPFPPPIYPPYTNHPPSNAIHLHTDADRHAGLQLYTAIPTSLLARLPPSIPYAQASVLPLAVSTATLGLYAAQHLNLPLPRPDPPTASAARDTLLIWGGASSVGSVAIQLARASNLRVVTTTRGANADYARRLGADVVVDYTASDAVDQLVAACAPSDTGSFVGVFDAIGEAPSVRAWSRVVERLGVPVRVSGALPLTPHLPADVAWPAGFPDPTFVVAFTITDFPELCEAVWGAFLPRALETRTVKAEPPAMVLGKGLEHSEAAISRLKEGVSAQKIVLEL
jgi:NADPH:quinone reductase-like Zn-dependent oxidoreductase